METGFLAAFSKKVISTIIAVGSMFYSTIDGVTPFLDTPEITFRNENLVVSTTITNCYTEEFDQILLSGNIITINFLAELFQENTQTPDTTISFFHTLQYSPIGKDFTVYFSEFDVGRTSLTMEQAKVLFPQIYRHNILSVEHLKNNGNFYLQLTAWLDKIQIEGLEEELNLLYYWNSIKPNSKSAIFSRYNFQS